MNRRPESDAGSVPAEVQELRRQIDALDSELVRLLNERSRCAVKIGRLKGGAGLAIHDPEREHQILRRIARESEGPLGDDALARLFERILDESRRLERLDASTSREPAPGIDPEEV